MRKDNIIQQKTLDFGLRIVKVYKYLSTEHHEYVLSRQLLKSGTSIGANVEESIGAQSKPDFLTKLTIAYKEARETIYWLKLLVASEYLTKEMFDSLFNDAEEICKIIGKIQISLKK